MSGDKIMGWSIKSLYKGTYLYLGLPLFIFLLSWLDYEVATILAPIFAFAFYKLWQNIGKDNKKCLSMPMIWWALGVAAIWCFFAGIGYFYYQSWDYHFRNAVFRDLISYDWPVFYLLANTPFVYYMGFWLIPALIGKLAMFMGANLATAIYIGNIFLFIYAAIGLALIFLHIAVAVNAKNYKKLLSAAFIFMFFSGADIIGYLFFQEMEQPFAYHLDWWASFMQYSSMATGMFWVFNQFIMTGLILFLIYNEQSVKSFGFLMPIALFYAPYPTATLGILAVIVAISQWLKAKNKEEFFWQNIFSIPNILAVFWILPVVVLYFMTNTEGMDKLWYVFDFTTPSRLLLFMILEFLLYAAVLWQAYHKELFFKAAVILLILIPFFRIDQQNNFCMRASMPALMLISLFTVKFLLELSESKKLTLNNILLIILFLIGSATPVTEFYRGLHYTFEAGKINLVKDEIYTLNQPFVRMPEFGWSANHQYTAQNYRTDIFWHWLAHRNIPDTYF